MIWEILRVSLKAKMHTALVTGELETILYSSYLSLSLILYPCNSYIIFPFKTIYCYILPARYSFRHFK